MNDSDKGACLSAKLYGFLRMIDEYMFETRLIDLVL